MKHSLGLALKRVIDRNNPDAASCLNTRIALDWTLKGSYGLAAALLGWANGRAEAYGIYRPGSQEVLHAVVQVILPTAEVVYLDTHGASSENELVDLWRIHFPGCELRRASIERYNREEGRAGSPAVDRVKVSRLIERHLGHPNRWELQFSSSARKLLRLSA